MATSGSKSVSVTAYDTLKFSWTAGAQNIDKNQTPVSWKLQLISVKYGAISSSASKAWSVTVNGTKYSGTNTVGIAENATKTLASGTTTITHDADGSKSFNFSFSQEFNINFNGQVGTKSGSGSGTLNTIPRATTPKITPTSQDLDKEITIDLSGRASSGFTHTLSHDFFANEWTVFTTKSASTSINFKLPLAWAEKIPNTTSGRGRIRCQTYNGNTLIGEKILDFTATVPSTIVPTVDTVTVTEAEPGLASKFGAFIQNHSKFKIVSTASGASGSTIQSYETKAQAEVLTGSTVNTGVITGSGEIPITVTVTDSRGRKGTKTVNASVLAYDPPQLTYFTAYRSNTLGDEDDEGTCVTVDAVFEIARLGDKNDHNYKIEYREGDTGNWQEVQSGSKFIFDGSFVDYRQLLDVDKSYQVRLIISDYFTELPPFFVDISTTFTLADVHESGTGLAFGKVAESENLIDVNLPTRFRKEVQFDSEWHDLTIDNAYKLYQDRPELRPRYKVIAGHIEINGTLSPKVAYMSSADRVPIASGIPPEYRPDINREFVCQGSGMNRWECTVTTDGTIVMARYGTSDFANVPAGAWLPFSVGYNI